MKIVLDVEEKKLRKRNDVIVFDNAKNKWKVVSKLEFLEDVYNQLNFAFKNIGNIEDEIQTFKDNVNKTLEEYHDVLRELTKENN